MASKIEIEISILFSEYNYKSERKINNQNVLEGKFYFPRITFKINQSKTVIHASLVNFNFKILNAQKKTILESQ